MRLKNNGFMSNKYWSVALLSLILFACQNDNKSTQKPNDTTPSQITKLDIKQVVKENEIIFTHITGKYPSLVGDEYKLVNQDIKQVIDELNRFDTEWNKEPIGFVGVSDFNYSIIHFDDKILSFVINFEISDMTARYFEKYYQIDLVNKRQVQLKEYLAEQKVDIGQANQAIINYLKPCQVESNMPEFCDGTSSYLISGIDFNDNSLDMLDRHDSFYIADKDNIIIAFNSAKFTTRLKLNLRDFNIEFS